MAVARIARRLRRETQGEHSAPVISALAVLNGTGPTTLGELAHAEGIARPTMTVLAAALEREGLLRREKDPADGRLVRVSITAAGRDALARSRTRKNAFLARRLRTLDQDELAALERAIDILERVVEPAV